MREPGVSLARFAEVVAVVSVGVFLERALESVREETISQQTRILFTSLDYK